MILMPDYTFHTLSDADFEDLACDLLGVSLKISFQSFAQGRDSGVDLLHGTRVSGSTVVQCKHYCRSKFTNLKSKIITEEVPKLAKLRPRRFILATSLGLTPQNKEELLKLLAPYCNGIHDIYGRDDINALLRQHPAVETAHHKLWLTSVPVLQRVLRHGAAVWNAMTKEDIERKMSLYVQTEAYGAALDILGEHNYCILSGIPGIGKTTLAQVLVTLMMDEGYELIAVRDDVQEAFEALDLRKKQVVYYDDFLGQSSISERLGKNEDRGIVRLLTESRRAKHLKVVFTTREYILEDAKRVYEPLNRGDLDVAKCVVKVEDYTRGLRARILYNHIYFSGLPRTYAAALLKDKAYRLIVDHDGYSPRIVEWMTLGAGPAGVQPDSYVDKFVQVLDDPAQLWQHAFENQIGEDARAVLYCVGTIEGWLGLDELRIAWANLRGLPSNNALPIESKKAFLAAMKQLDGSFVRTTRMHSETAVEFHNPSIKDYVRKRIVSDPDVRNELLRKALFFEQVSCLVRLSATGQVRPDPSQLIPNDAMLQEAIERTLDAKAATYQFIQYRADRERRLARMDADVGKRLTAVANWAKSYRSKALLQFSCRIAADLVASGDAAKAATLNACGFLDALVKAYPGGEQTTSVVRPFLTHIDEHLSEAPSAADWTQWTNFLRNNEALFDERDMAEWGQRADSFCMDEIDAIIENAESSSQAQEWYDEVVSVAKRWDVSLQSKQQEFDEWLKELQGREEGPDRDDDDWRGSRSADRMTGSDAEIDRLFSSLNDKALP
ncbi:MAG TPA: hypothetical protein VG099_01310 [Gemmataceae bacterium]|jgi:hypothetical protein|nr:hypothetical protein [Gemmataceae bacterium]